MITDVGSTWPWPTPILLARPNIDACPIKNTNTKTRTGKTGRLNRC